MPSASAGTPKTTIRALTASDRPWVSDLVSAHFGSARVVSRGVLHEATALPGLMAEYGGRRVGVLLYDLDVRPCEVVVLVVERRRHGVGRALLEAVEPIARAAGCRRLWLVTTNNNRGALSFYPAVGWRQVAVHRGAVAAARRLKPELPEVDEHGTPIEDEIEFARRL